MNNRKSTRKILKRKEVPQESRQFFNFKKQKTIGDTDRTKKRRLMIERTCSHCDEKNMIRVSKLRQTIKNWKQNYNNEPYKPFCRHCWFKIHNYSSKGPANPRWKGGIKYHEDGYILVRSYNHPSNRTDGYVFQHRLVIEKKIGRYLKANEFVHHINGIKSDNRPENLELWTVSHPRGQRIQEYQHCITCTCHYNHKEEEENKVQIVSTIN